MTHDELIEAASELAADLHEGTVDKAGKPYILHLDRVARILVERWPDAPADEIAAAWLHDAIEDTGINGDTLRHAGISDRAIEIVKILTKPAGANYLQWIEWLAYTGDIGAIRVKLADNADNSDPDRVAAFNGGAEMVRRRYAPAREILEHALKARSRSRSSGREG